MPGAKQRKTKSVMETIISLVNALIDYSINYEAVTIGELDLAVSDSNAPVRGGYAGNLEKNFINRTH